MPFDDLELEFEDEEESKTKKNDAVQVDVDLDFSVPDSAKARPVPPVKPAPKPAAGGTSPSIPRPPVSKPAEVRKIDEARAVPPPPRPAAAVPPAPKPVAPAQPRVVGTSAVKIDNSFDLESQSSVEMQEHIRKIEFAAEVKVQVAEFKTEFLSEMLSDMKLASHQIEQLLVRINAKHPDMKNEVLMIKKILADLTTKKRK